MRTGDFFTQLKGNSKLEMLFNKSFKDLTTFRIISAPNYYSPEHNNISDSAVMYYELLVFENYTHQLIERLQDLKSTITIYNTEYKSSWRYFALANRQESVNEFGYDESDYDENGNLKTEFTDKCLESYTILQKYIGFNDAVFNMKPNHFERIYNFLHNKSEICITKMPIFKDLETYTNVGGKMVKLNFTDKVLNEAKQQAGIDTATNWLFSVFCAVTGLLQDLKHLKYNDDNIAFFNEAIGKIDSIMALKVEFKTLPL